MLQFLGSEGQRSRLQHDHEPSWQRHTELNAVHQVLISSSTLVCRKIMDKLAVTVVLDPVPSEWTESADLLSHKVSSLYLNMFIF